MKAEGMNAVGNRIAITGELRSGKDAVTDHLSHAHGFHRAAFGDELKALAHATLPWIPHEPKPRALYQTFGQRMRVDYGADIWIRHLERRVSRMPATAKIVLSDLRQPNEYDWARANGFTVLRVTAPESVRLERANLAGDTFEIADLAHDTERHVGTFEVDYEIVNDGSLDELYAKVEGLLSEKGAIQ